jgi:hypothetical protein
MSIQGQQWNCNVSLYSFLFDVWRRVVSATGPGKHILVLISIGPHERISSIPSTELGHATTEPLTIVRSVLEPVDAP